MSTVRSRFATFALYALSAVVVLPTGTLASQPIGPLAPLASSFTYQGRLLDGGGGANGAFDFRFTLYDADEGGSIVAGPVVVPDIQVTDGLFTVELDLGAAAFVGQARWLGIETRPAGTATYVPVAPRQPLSPTPFATWASRAPWSGITGIPAGFADGIDDNTVVSVSTGLLLDRGDLSIASSYRLPQACAGGSVAKWQTHGIPGWYCATDNIGSGAAAWTLQGNAGTDPTTQFLGTTDSVAMEVRVGGARALRLEPTTETPNVVGGFADNAITPGTLAAAIGGGGVGGFANTVTDHGGVVGGGWGNRAGDNAGTVEDRQLATVGGGMSNLASGGFSTIGGGVANVASATSATVPGGSMNRAAGLYSLAAGRRAKADADGVFAWADGTNADFAVTTANQFAVRASGGVRFSTSGSGAQVDGHELWHSGNAIVGTANLADDSVTAPKIAANAVGSSEIAANAVGSSEIATGAVGADEIATDAVPADEIADDAVGATEINATLGFTMPTMVLAWDGTHLLWTENFLKLPFDGTVSTSDEALMVTNTGFGRAICGAMSVGSINGLGCLGGASSGESTGTGVAGWGQLSGGFFKETLSNVTVEVATSTYKIVGDGAVSFVQNHPENAGEVIVYAAPEGDEVATYTRGMARLANGEVRVSLGETFRLVTNPDIGLTAHLTPVGSWCDLYVAEKGTDTLLVRSRDGEDCAFDYVVFGLRIGFEGVTIVQEKKRESYIPAMTAHRELLARRPDLERYTALSRFTALQSQVSGVSGHDTPRADALRMAIHEFDPAVDSGGDPPAQRGTGAPTVQEVRATTPAAAAPVSLGANPEAQVERLAAENRELRAILEMLGRRIDALERR